MSAGGVTREKRHTRAHPCAICGGFDEQDRGEGKRCSGFDSDDGAWIRCSREEFAGGLTAERGLFRHIARGDCNCGVTHAPFRSSSSKPEAIYEYKDAFGKLLCQVTRWPGKRFSQRRPDGVGGWIGDAQGVPWTLYRLERLAKSTGPVWIVEGEKDVETLERRGLVATTWRGGANQAPDKCDWSFLRGRNCIVIADKDGEKQRWAGQKHAAAVAAILKAQGSTVSGPWECTSGKDVTEHLANSDSLSPEDGALVPMQSPGNVEPAKAAAPATETRKRPAIRTVPSPVDHEETWGHDEPPRENDESKPEIVIGPDTHRVIDEIVSHMVRLDDRVFQRSYELVTVVGSTDAKLLANGTPVLRPFCADALVPRLTERVRFVAITKPSKNDRDIAEASGGRAPVERKDAPAPKQALASLLVSPDRWHGVRPLRGVTESPLFRPDGTIRQDRGYDDATGYLVLPSCDYPRVEDEPTQDDARAALAELVDVFCDFPYADEPSRYVPIAAILTVLARAAIDEAVPAFLFDASVMGSGKTLQCDIVHMIATGRFPAHANWPVRDEDQEKLLSSYAFAAPQALVLDNVKGLLGGSTLEMMLTGPVVEFRVFGTQTLRSVPWIGVILVSGNNVQPTEDMVRRTLMSRIESPLARPQDRSDFKRPQLLAWVRAERPRLVSRALTILRAFAAKGCPDTGCRMASFQPFARLVAGAIRFAGGPDVTLAKPPEERASFDAAGAARELCDLWDTLPLAAAGPQTLKSMLGSIYPPPARNDPPDGFQTLRDAIESLAPPKGIAGPDPNLLGKRLSQFVGRWWDNGKRFRAQGMGKNKTLHWWVEPR